jgi:hypothetical protein
MKYPSLALSCLALLGSAFAPLSAQTNLPIALPSLDPDVVQHQTDTEGVLWSRGANFKLRTAADGVSFVPFFGSRAPHNFPVHFALADATVGGQELELDRGAAPAREGDVVRFDRGPIDEVYEIAPRSLEQKFVIDRPRESGELVLRIAIDTELAATARDDGFDFSNEFGSVHCGRATAVDANGRSLALDSELGDGVLSIRVPASFVAEAAFPLVVDPLWFTFDVENGSAVTLAPDVAHGNGAFLFAVWEVVYSQTDHDIRAAIFDGNGSAYSSFYLDYSGTNWARPRVAHLTVGDLALVVAEVGPQGSRSVWGVTIGMAQPGSPNVGGQFQISDPNVPVEKSHPEVGGDPYPTPASFFCVVYELYRNAARTDIQVAMVDWTGAMYSSFTLDGTQNVLNTAPSISKSDDATTWNIAWQRETGPGHHEIYFARVDWDGQINEAPFWVTSSSSDKRRPTVSGPIQGTTRYMIAWEEDCFTGFCDYNIYAALMDDGYVKHVHALPFTQYEESDAMIESNGRHFVCAYTRANFMTGNDVIAAEIQPFANDFEVGEWAIIAGGGQDEKTARITCHEDSDQGGFTNLYWIIYNRGSDIAMAAYAGLEGGTVTPFCYQIDPGVGCPCGHNSYLTGCPNSTGLGAYLAASGNASTANDTLTFGFGWMPPNVSALVFQGTTTSNFTFGDGFRCIGTPTIRFPIRNANSVGDAWYGAAYGDVPISVRGGVPMIGGTFYYQVWYRDPASFCTLATTNLTNALRVNWTL